MESLLYLAGREILIGLSGGRVFGCARAAAGERGKSANPDEW